MAGGMYEVDQVGKIQEITDEVFNVEAQKYPFTSMVPKDKKPHEKIATFQSKVMPNVANVGILDGVDVTTFSKVPRYLLTAVAQLFRQPWMVSKFANVTDIAGLASEKAEQKADATELLKKQMEQRFLSASVCLLDNASDAANETRGAFDWLNTAEQVLYPVPAVLRPVSAYHYTGTLANLTEPAFRALLDAAFQVRKGEMTYDGFVGISLKTHIDDWSVRDPNAGASNMPVRTFNQDAAKRAMVTVIDTLTFSSGTVRLHPVHNLLMTAATGAATANTPLSGLFLDMAMWALAFLQQPQMHDMEDQGGGPRGYADAIAVLKCFNPLAQIACNIAS